MDRRVSVLVFSSKHTHVHDEECCMSSEWSDNLKYSPEGSGAHMIKKTRFQSDGCTFNYSDSESGVGLVLNRCSCSRTAKTGTWTKSGFGAHRSIKIDIHPKNFPIDVTLCADSESVIRNMIAFRNREITFKNRF